MNDSFVNALNTQKNTADWMDAVAENLTNIYTPGYRETKANFKIRIESNQNLIEITRRLHGQVY